MAGNLSATDHRRCYSVGFAVQKFSTISRKSRDDKTFGLGLAQNVQGFLSCDQGAWETVELDLAALDCVE